MELTEKEKKELLSAARGSWQTGIIKDLIRYGEIDSPLGKWGIRGKAAKYKGRYQESFSNLCSRIREKWFEVVWIPGKRGGEWTSTYRLERLAEQEQEQGA